ncbi:MAG: sulfite exporter TauE/SafE family protein, partial [Notoacmeibacter sp.]
MLPILSDPNFYLAAIPAVLLVGLSKGGFGGPMALVGVPIMALVISPVQAAAIMLPILIVSDVIALWGWRGQASWETLKRLMPGGIIGVGVGWMLASQTSPDAVKLLVGLIAIIFVLRMATQKLAGQTGLTGENTIAATFWGGLAGFTSFVAHAGAPPYQVYALRLGHSPAVYAATNTVFFAATNVLKLLPYFMLGQFDASNLSTSAILAPLAIAATITGIWLTKRISPKVFYPMM